MSGEVSFTAFLVLAKLWSWQFQSGRLMHQTQLTARKWAEHSGLNSEVWGQALNESWSCTCALLLEVFNLSALYVCGVHNGVFIPDASWGQELKERTHRCLFLVCLAFSRMRGLWENGRFDEPFSPAYFLFFPFFLSFFLSSPPSFILSFFKVKISSCEPIPFF